MSDTLPNSLNDAAAAAMAALLASDVSPEEFTRRLLAINIEQARALDAELPELLRACAIPRQFDADIIGVLRDAPDDAARNEALLEQIRSFSFVKPHAGGGYVFHDNVRDVLLEEWRAAPGDRYAALIQRLAALYLQRGEEALEIESFEVALATYSAAIELAPENGEAYSGRGKTYCQLQDYQSALGDLAKAIDLDPDDGENYWWLGVVYYRLKNHSAALSNLTHAITIQPENGDNYYLRGLIYYVIKDYSSMLSDFFRLATLQPDNDGIYYWIGLANYQLKNFSAALIAFTRTIKLQTENNPTYYWRGVTHYQLKNYPFALIDLNRAVELQPENGYPYCWRGQVNYQLKDYQSALADLTRAIKLLPENGEAYYWRGETYYALKNYQSALTDLNYSIELQPENSNSHYLRNLIRNELTSQSLKFNKINGIAKSGLNHSHNNVYPNGGVLALARPFPYDMTFRPFQPWVWLSSAALLIVSLMLAALALLAREPRWLLLPL
ncbi:hypothetical protein SE17_23855, partial [Kouleothrix aurantiaca]